VAEQCHAAGVIFVFAYSWTKVAQVDKSRGHFFAFANSWTKVAQADKFRGYFFGFASSWTKVTQSDKLKGRRCILLTNQSVRKGHGDGMRSGNSGRQLEHALGGHSELNGDMHGILLFQGNSEI
jgi:hypothetical protein